MDFQISLPPRLQAAVDLDRQRWNIGGGTARLWRKDASLWSGTDEAVWLGWLDIVERQQAKLADYTALAADIRSAGFKHALLLGMGGSSLCPEVLAITFGHQAGYPSLHIVDSTDPAQVAAADKAVDLSKTVVIVASKSGSTLEPNILKQYFFRRMQQTVGAENAGSHFIAITDPGSKMEQVAKADKFRAIYYGDPAIGGRFSALSNFGIVPATIIGLNIQRFLTQARIAVDEAKKDEIDENPAIHLGLILGAAHNIGINKLTILTSPEIYDLGAWLEQLIAESTGKLGKGITPVDRETLAAPGYYGKDRLFAVVRLKDGRNDELDAGIAALEEDGQPVVRFEIDSGYDIPGQFFTWEIATAVAGSLMGINPFNQPDVEASKIETRRLTDEYEKTGKLAVQVPIAEGGGLKIFADEAYAAIVAPKDGGITSPFAVIRNHIAQIQAGDYFAPLAYIENTKEHEAAIQSFRIAVRDAKKVATCLGFGPRFLHSTGQDYKGGPNTGVFLQITADHAADVAIPEAKYTFGIVIDAQAAGDLAVLQQRKRRALRVHLGTDVAAGLKTLGDAVVAALK
jgi:glucose-6-phosphate isomerase